MSKENKYHPLCKYLKKTKHKTVRLSDKKIEKILGFSLPKSSSLRTWWSNDPYAGHTQAHAWREAGFWVRVDKVGIKIFTMDKD